MKTGIWRIGQASVASGTACQLLKAARVSLSVE